MPPPPPPTSTTAPSLPDELLEEVFLRLPPDEPAFLVRASLASKLWLGLLSGPRFRRRYGEFHGAPPMLGFLYSWPYFGIPSEEEEPVANFVSTTKFAARAPDDHGYTPWDCRHGRVLLGNHYKYDMRLIVWDPMTGRRMKLESPAHHWVAAVLCAVSDCDHRACHEGPFRVVFVGLDRIGHDDDDCVAHACVYLSETAEWSEQCPGLHLTADTLIDEMPPLLVGNAFHFMLVFVLDDDLRVGILKYDLGSNCLSLVDGPPLEGSVFCGTAILMAMADGSLGFAHVDRLTLYMWSRQMGSDGVASWTERAIIDLKNLLPVQNPNIRLRLIGSVEGSDIIFVTTDLDIYEINLKSLQWKKLWKRENFQNFCALIPYMSFYSPQGLQNDGDRKKLPEGSSVLQQTAVRAHDVAGAAPAGGLPRITEAGEEDLEI